MLSLKATLKAIGESITTIKSALDGKATKYTGYGTPVTLTTSWYTIPSDGFIHMHMSWEEKGYRYVTIEDTNGKQMNFFASTLVANYAQGSVVIPVFKGQKAKILYAVGNSHEVHFVPFV